MQEKQYKVNPQHRNGNPNKSQWRVSIDVELNLFKVSYDSCWFNQDKTLCAIKAYGMGILLERHLQI